MGSHVLDGHDKELFDKHLLFNPATHKKYIAEEYYFQQNDKYFAMQVAQMHPPSRKSRGCIKHASR